MFSRVQLRFSKGLVRLGEINVALGVLLVLKTYTRLHYLTPLHYDSLLT